MARDLFEKKKGSGMGEGNMFNLIYWGFMAITFTCEITTSLANGSGLVNTSQIMSNKRKVMTQGLQRPQRQGYHILPPFKPLETAVSQILSY